MELEEIKLGSDTLKLATNVFQYNQGKLVSATPIQQAMEGVDTIMVGGAGKSTDRNIFKLKADTNTASVLDGGDLYIWGSDTGSDVIDLTDFITSKPTAAALIDAVVEDQTHSVAGAKSFKINLDANNDFDLMIHFMGVTAVTPITETLVEAMITKAYPQL